MKLVIRLARTISELRAAHQLVEEAYRSKGYVSGVIDEVAPLMLTCCSEDGRMVGAAGMYPPTEVLPVEFFYALDITEHLPPSWDRGRVIEIGRVAKAVTRGVCAGGAEERLIFPALIVAMARFCVASGYRAWTASLKPHFIRELQRLGINPDILPVQVVASRVPLKYAGYFLTPPQPKVIIYPVTQTLPAVARLYEDMREYLQIDVEPAQPMYLTTVIPRGHNSA